MGEVDAEADDHRLPFPLEQDARQLRAGGEEVVGPFDADADRGREGRSDFVEGDGGGERKGRRGRIAGTKADEGAGVEIARGRVPGPPLPALACGLPLGAKPAAFWGAGAGERGEIVVGRGRLGDGSDQKSALAALRDTSASGPTTR
jgi:hypothetical protein